MRHLSAFVAALLLAGCAATPRLAPGPYLRGPVVDDPHVPPFADAGWEPFRRAAAVAIALREWRLFGSPIDDDPPGSRPPLPQADRPEREEGLWQRVGEYWWDGVPPNQEIAAATGIHSPRGTEVADDTDTPWSAAFISYVMRLAGAASRFPYSASHSTYINAAASGSSPILRAEPPATYPPALGDLVCHARGAARTMSFADLPTSSPFTSHCDIVVGVAAGELAVIGGNVDDAVTLHHIPLDGSSHIADPTTPYVAVLQVLYDE